MTTVTIRHFTDPGCPLAFAAERRRLRLVWLYGEQIEWEPHMVVLRPDRGPRWPRGDDATIHACRAVVAAGLRWPERQDALLRRLRVLSTAGELLDDSDTLEIAAGQAGLPVAEIAAYCAEPEVERALRTDMAAARPSPSYELIRGATRAELHGADAVEAFEAALATLAPELTRRPDPASVEEALAWAGMAVTTAEVAAICAREIAAVRPELARVARFEPAGDDGYWSLGAG